MEEGNGADGVRRDDEEDKFEAGEGHGKNVCGVRRREE